MGFEGAPDVTIWKLFKKYLYGLDGIFHLEEPPLWRERVHTPARQHRQGEKGRKPMECKSLHKGEATWAQVGQQEHVPLSTGHPQGLDSGCSRMETQRKPKGQVRRDRWNVPAHWC